MLTRREMLALLGTAGAAVIIAACTPAAVRTASLPASGAVGRGVSRAVGCACVGYRSGFHVARPQ